MNEQLMIILISAGTASLFNGFFSIFRKWMDFRKEMQVMKQKNVDTYYSKKEECYIMALDRLLQIRRGLDYTREAIQNNKSLKKLIDDENSMLVRSLPKMRLYSSDKIFNQYYNMASKYIRFTYTSVYGPRLIENSKFAFDTQITLLARRMQEDLGLRKYNMDHDVIQCPVCGKVHDLVSTCPECKLTFEGLQIKIDEIVAQALEIQDTIDEKNETESQDSTS